MEKLKEDIYSFVRLNGPVIPVQISQSINSNLLFTSAMLSSLVSEKKILITRVKLGGSPFYYTNEQKFKLQSLVKHLPEKPRRVCELLREKKVLWDKKLEPFQRVAIREISDFAFQIIASFNNQQEIFWRWYLLPENDAKELISSMLSVKKEPQKIEKHIEKPLQELRSVQKPRPDNFFNMVVSYLDDNKFKVIDQKIVRKNTEFNFLIDVNTDLGSIRFFVKAKNKKRISDTDLSLAYLERKERPVLFLSTGDLTKKGRDYISNHLRSNMIFKKL